MKDVDRRLVELAGQPHQAFSRAQALALGLSASTLCRRLQAGTLVACGPRSLCFPVVTLAWRAPLHAGLLHLGPDALVSGHAAAALLRLDGFDEGRIEYLVPRSQRRRTTVGVVTSSPKISKLAKLDRVVVDGLPCVSGTRSVVQLLGRASEREIGNALDSGTRQGITAPSVVRARLDEHGTWCSPTDVRLRVSTSRGRRSQGRGRSNTRRAGACCEDRGRRERRHPAVETLPYVRW